MATDDTGKRTIPVCGQQQLQRLRCIQIYMQTTGDGTHQRVLALGCHQHVYTLTAGRIKVGNSTVTVRGSNQQQTRMRLLSIMISHNLRRLHHMHHRYPSRRLRQMHC